MANYDNAIKFITTHDDSYITYKNEEYETYQKILQILESTKIISERQLFKKTDNLGERVTDTELIAFPDVFRYCKEQVLDDLMRSLTNSQKQSWGYKHREIQSSSFETAIYTKKKFIEDTATLIKVEEVIKIAGDISQKLLGQLDHPVFCDHGDMIKDILTSELLTIDHAFLEQRLKDVKNEAMFFGKKAEIQEFCLGLRKIVLGNDKTIELLDNQSFAKDEVIAALKKIIDIAEESYNTEQNNFNSLLMQLGFNVGGNIFAKHQLVQVIRDKTLLKEEQINYILTHLEVYEKLSVDHAFLEQRFKDVKNEAIFFGKKAEIQEFCLGRRKIVLSGDKIIELLDNQSFAKDEIVAALKKIVQISDSPSLADKTSFDALLIRWPNLSRLKIRNYEI
ncbi:hypothetical protein N3Z16_07305 [Candidatus Megaera polyxenophila]|uniref:hypothetical protein n=1 Tax=Candidatus Megaera polyxenophila TaxID=988779 RepID=UPI00249DBE18|nr:hypothetical protein N3Z16_07305 [Candidatus Megaera polyxenophila]